MTHPIFEVFTKRDERTYKLPVNTHSIERATLVLNDLVLDIHQVSIDTIMNSSMIHFLRIRGIPVLFTFSKVLKEITFYPKPDGQYKILVEYTEECKACHGKGYENPF